MKRELFVSYEIALLAKQRGFNEKCFGRYFSHIRPNPVELEIKITDDTNEKFIKAGAGRLCVAPIYEQLIEWFFNKHELIISTGFMNNIKKWDYEVYSSKLNGKEYVNYYREQKEISKGRKFNNRLEALESAFLEAFKLIGNDKENIK